MRSRTRAVGTSPNFPQQVIYSGAGIDVPSTFLAGTFTAPFIGFGASSSTSITAVDASANTLTIASNNGRLARAQYATFTETSGSLPPPLQLSTRYTIGAKTPGTDTAAWTTFTLLDGSGNTIDLTSGGSGTHTVRLSLDDLQSPVGAFRTLDSSAPSWAAMNPSDGVYDWSRMDEYLDLHYKTLGRVGVLCFNQTPTWAARNAANDAYAYAGGGQVPTDITKINTFLVQLLRRYCQVSAYNPSGDQMFSFVEVWNEPTFSSTGTAGVNWCGTTGELSQATRQMRLAIDAEAPGVALIGPGFTSGAAFGGIGAANGIHAYLLASDGSGGAAKDHLDGVSFHAYNMNKSSELIGYSARINLLRQTFVHAGMSSNTPIYQTESGVDDVNDVRCHARRAIVGAALGIQMDVTYQWDSFGCNPRDYQECRTWLEFVGNALPESTITYCAIMQRGEVQFTADGQTYTV